MDGALDVHIQPPSGWSESQSTQGVLLGLPLPVTVELPPTIFYPHVCMYPGRDPNLPDDVPTCKNFQLLLFQPNSRHL